MFILAGKRSKKVFTSNREQLLAAPLNFKVLSTSLKQAPQPEPEMILILFTVYMTCRLSVEVVCVCVCVTSFKLSLFLLLPPQHTTAWKRTLAGTSAAVQQTVATFPPDGATCLSTSSSSLDCSIIRCKQSPACVKSKMCAGHFVESFTHKTFSSL